jgi:NAD(P)-dependent dehydrogenase (short-subunit alcohol dehydrogenase family)
LEEPAIVVRVKGKSPMNDDSNRLHTAVALVTGANRGLGKALVSALLAAGASRVYAAARDEKSIPRTDPRVEPLRLDVTQPEQVAAAARRATDVTLLINNAGRLSSFNVLSTTPAELEADFDVQVHGTLSVIKAFVPILARGAGGATIVNVLSLASLASVPTMGGYSASKAAAYSVTQALRPELAKRSIRVLAALPGPIDTDMTKNLELPKTSASEAAERIVAGIVRGDEEIFPDRMSEQMGPLWLRDPKAYERAFAGF